MRADARRNRDRLVSVASEVVAEQGAEASLEEIARRAGVGSATLHRHFPSRLALLDAVFAERVTALCDHGDRPAGDPGPGEALMRGYASWSGTRSRNRGLGDVTAEGHRRVVPREDPRGGGGTGHRAHRESGQRSVTT